MMNKIWIIALLAGGLFLSSCEKQTAQNSANNAQNKNALTETKPAEKSAERHIKIKSENSFDETYALLKKTIESKEPLTIIAELDHSANAKKAGMELRPTKIIMFGNPKLGTPLMKADQEIGIDLPQKMLVYENDKGEVFIVYNNPESLTENYQISGQDETIAKISEALKGLAETAAKKESQIVIVNQENCLKNQMFLCETL